MPPIISNLKRRYKALLERSLDTVPSSAQAITQRLGKGIATSQLSIVDLALLHERILSEHLLPVANPRQRLAITRQAGDVFGAVVAAADIDDSGKSGAIVHLPAVLSSLSERSRELAETNASLMKEVEQRKSAEAALAKSEGQCQEMLCESERLQNQLRHLSRQLLAAQEEERCKISRELHDVIGQTLTGINIQLTTLKQEVRINTSNLEQRIARTQRMVNRSVAIVHRFARELRPAVLDDLGILPALQAHLTSITRRSSVQVSLSLCPEVDRLTTSYRTALYRIAQEALSNVVRHAQAKEASLTITRSETGLRMVIHDNGKGFSVSRAYSARHNKRLGLLGMRERVEMIGGRLTITSNARQGTTISIIIPMDTANKDQGPGKRSSLANKES